MNIPPPTLPQKDAASARVKLVQRILYTSAAGRRTVFLESAQQCRDLAGKLVEAAKKLESDNV